MVRRSARLKRHPRNSPTPPTPGPTAGQTDEDEDEDDGEGQQEADDDDDDGNPGLHDTENQPKRQRLTNASIKRALQLDVNLYHEYFPEIFTPAPPPPPPPPDYSFETVKQRKAREAIENREKRQRRKIEVELQNAKAAATAAKKAQTKFALKQVSNFEQTRKDREKKRKAEKTARKAARKAKKAAMVGRDDTSSDDSDDMLGLSDTEAAALDDLDDLMDYCKITYDSIDSTLDPKDIDFHEIQEEDADDESVHKPFGNTDKAEHQNIINLWSTLWISMSIIVSTMNLTELTYQAFAAVVNLLLDNTMLLLQGYVAAGMQPMDTFEMLGRSASEYRLPKALKTLHGWREYGLPTSRIKARRVNIDTDVLPSAIARKLMEQGGNPQAYAYYFSMIDTFKHSLTSRKTKKVMYFGQQCLVKEEKELWHARVWGESILSCSAQFSYYKTSTSTKDPIIPGDIVLYARKAKDGMIKKCPARVRQVARDFKFKSSGDPVVVLEPLVTVAEVLGETETEYEQLAGFPKRELEKLTGKLNLGELALDDLVLIEELELVVSISSIRKCNPSSIGFVNPKDNNSHASPAKQQLIELVVNLKGDKVFRPAHLRHALLAELEVKAFGGREAFKIRMIRTDGKEILTIPYTMFVNGFALWGKGNASYYSMLGAYTTLGNIPAFMRRQQNAQNVTHLSEMGAAVQQCAEVLSTDSKALFFGTEVQLPSRSRPTIIHANIIAFVGDMIQQSLSCGIRRVLNKRSCRMCLVLKEERSVADYPIHASARFMHVDEALRRTYNAFDGVTDPETALKDRGLQAHSSYWLPGNPALDTVRLFPQEPCHVLPSGVGGIMLELLFDHILSSSKPRRAAFGAAIKSMPTTIDWFSLQDPIHYLGSYSYNQNAQLLQLAPFAMRKMMTNDYMKKHAVKAFYKIFAAEMKENNWDACDVACWIYEKYAELQYLAFQPKFTDESAAQFRTACTEFVRLFSRLAKVPKEKHRKKFGFRSLIHAVLHLPDTRDLYGTLTAVDCSPGEQRHRLQKINVRNSNHKGVVRQCIRKVDVADTLRLVKEGCFDETHPNMVKKILEAEKFIPMIFERLAPTTRKEKAEASANVTIEKEVSAEEEEIEGPPLVDCNVPVQMDGINLSIIHDASKGRNEALYPKKSTPDDVFSGFRNDIMNLLNQEDETAVSILTKLNFTYFQRCTFISTDVSGHERKITAKTGRPYHFNNFDNIGPTESFCAKLNFFATVKFKNVAGRDVSRNFAIVNPIIPSPKPDRVLSAKILQCSTDTSFIFRLEHITHQQIHLLPYEPREDLQAHHDKDRRIERFYSNDWYLRRV
ncbi:hypothetical protein BJ508DRAFT_311096 [Ascobolus immersus RN42]|uniref:Uncharacterized protein n=1 Tax=Ascobolus immersus RN42 TaxID=1160509 RepID=A0A3N4I3N5_ASCIM|nr:hypothetical protein BJ508DRAFT_311096 [Ascobolus immersus RN42]